jgi:hypothetical protein
MKTHQAERNLTGIPRRERLLECRTREDYYRSGQLGRPADPVFYSLFIIPCRLRPICATMALPYRSDRFPSDGIRPPDVVAIRPSGMCV